MTDIDGQISMDIGDKKWLDCLSCTLLRDAKSILVCESLMVTDLGVRVIIGDLKFNSI